jgi:hypothetical protein
MLSHSSLTSLSTTCYQHLSLSDLLKGNLLTRMQLLVQLGDWQYVLLPVLFTALEEIGDACLEVSGGAAAHLGLVYTAGGLHWGPVLASRSCTTKARLLS